MEVPKQQHSREPLEINQRSTDAFIDSTLRRIANENYFGPGKLLSIRGRASTNGTHHYMSRIEFKTVTLSLDSGSTEVMPVVVKVHSDANRNGVNNERARCMFRNEACMFNVILPILGAQDVRVFPKHFYSDIGNSHSSDIIILKDLSKEGFTILQKTIFDKDEMSLLMKKLGQFHGLSFRLKKQDPSCVQFLKSSLRPTKHYTHGESHYMLHRGIPLILAERLMKDSGEMKKLARILRSERDVTLDLRTPEEPFAAIVHSDLFKSNIFVKYSEDDRRMTDARFIDLQTCFYSDPAFDFTFLLFACASIELLEEHWDDFIDDYWSGITSVEPQCGFTCQQMKANIARKAFSGFSDACFFITVEMTPPGRFVFPPPTDDIDEVVSGAERVLRNVPQASNKLINLMNFLVEKDFVGQVLEQFDQSGLKQIRPELSLSIVTEQA